jgi:hypothetical protein
MKTIKKNIILIMPLFFLFAANEAKAQIKYPFGNASVLGQSAVDTSTDVGVDTLDISNRLTFADFAIDSTHTISVNPDERLDAGAMIYMKVENNTGSSSDNTLSFDANINATDETITAAKTSIIQLFYDGSVFNIVSIKQID